MAGEVRKQKTVLIKVCSLFLQFISVFKSSAQHVHLETTFRVQDLWIVSGTFSGSASASLLSPPAPCSRTRLCGRINISE